MSSPGCLGCAELSVCQTGRPSGKQQAHAEGSLEGGLGTAHKGMAGRYPRGGYPQGTPWGRAREGALGLETEGILVLGTSSLGPCRREPGQGFLVGSL